MTIPILAFGIVIFIGTFFLHSRICSAGEPPSWIDAIFISTSATCVTGLATININHVFNFAGWFVILCLIQLGGLGIMTYSALIFYILRKKITITNNFAIGRSLRHDQTFNLGNFIIRVVLFSFIIEAFGAFLLYIRYPDDFSPFYAIFHAVSAYCNAGFSLFDGSLVKWQRDWSINLIFISLIFLGGIGFSILLDIFFFIKKKILSLFKPLESEPVLSWYSTVILKTSFFLIIAGAVGIYFSEFIGFHRIISVNSSILGALFQSVTCRTAGFNTLNIEQMTNLSLLIMTILMFIGGASGSCAGGIKVSSFRVMLGFIISQIKGRKQAVIDKFATDDSTFNKALLLIIFSIIIITVAIMILNISEGGDIPHPDARGLSMEILFEAVSAFGTVGLSTGLTATLSYLGKIVIITLMFIGRLGPILFITVIQNFQKKESYLWPEKSLLIG